MTQAVPFVHLRMHSEFSLIDSMIRIKPLMKALQAEQMPAIALTDQSTMSGMIKFYKAAQSAGIKPICGCDVFIAETTEADATISRMTLLAMDSKGYLNLTELVSRSFQEGQIDGKAIIQKQWLADKSEGLIVLSGAAEGEIGRALINRGVAEAEQILRYWIGLFGDRFYLEVQRTGRQYDEDCLHLSAQLAQLAKVPIVATNDVMFVSAEDFEAHETRVCINQSMTLDDPRRLKAYSNQQYLRSAEEMQALFVDLPSALENSVQIAKRCNLDIQLGHYSLPNFPVPDGLTMDEFFGKVSRDGLEKRLKVILDATDPKYQAQRKIFDDRLEFELNIICQMKSVLVSVSVSGSVLVVVLVLAMSSPSPSSLGVFMSISSASAPAAVSNLSSVTFSSSWVLIESGFRSHHGRKAHIFTPESEVEVHIISLSKFHTFDESFH